MNPQEILLLDLTLEHIPHYGAFKFFDKLKAVDNSFYNLIQSYSGTQHLSITDFLCKDGFAAYTSNDQETIQLTDKGRELKNANSYSTFYKVLAENEIKKKKMEARQNMEFYLLIFVALSTIIQGTLAAIQIFGKCN